MNLRKEIFNILDREVSSNFEPNALTNEVISVIEKWIDERTEYVSKYKGVPDTIAELQRIKELLVK